MPLCKGRLLEASCVGQTEACGVPLFLSANPVGGGFVFLLVPPPFEYGLFYPPPELGDGKRFVTLADVTAL